LTSMFMHGGILHILGNMWFLWVFGDDIEAVFGKVWYLVFYLVCGVLASLAHVYVTYLVSDPGDPSMMIPSLGASGAISGVLGAYLVRFPTRRVTVILFRFLTQVPAWAAIGIWFAFQIVNSLGMLGGGSQAGGGVAYAAHVGGFAAGAATMLVYNLVAPEPPPSDYDYHYPGHERRWDQY
jgi:membrane associated rhomboid family serine protease